MVVENLEIVYMAQIGKQTENLYNFACCIKTYEGIPNEK